VTLLLPRGIVGTLRWWAERRRAAAPAEAQSEPPSSPHPAPRAAE
jgi:hypothetical protein